MNGDKAICLAAGAVFAVGLLHLGVRLHEVQVKTAADYNYASARQSIRRVRTGGVRGRIFDRHGAILADNREITSLVCHPAAFQQRTWEGTAAKMRAAVDALAAAIGRTASPSDAAIRRHVDRLLPLPLTVWRNLSVVELARFCEHEQDFPGFSVRVEVERAYPNGELAAHAIGWVGSTVMEAEPGDERFYFITPELHGKSGVEYQYDAFLSGVPGERKVLVDARGFAIREWSVVEEQRGPDLTLTLDLGIQRAVERQLSGRRGACVVLDPRSGEILALASAPTYDLNSVRREDRYGALSADPEKPLLNRASGGAYAPGSTFKPVTALAALSLGFPETEEYACNGVFELGGLRLHCARRWGHGDLDLRHALMVSCNPFFCNLGFEVGTNALIAAARACGLGAKTGVDLGVDMGGVVPDGAWKMRMYHEKWYQGDLAQMAIGQGMLLVSPLQMALVAGAIGTGYGVTPHLKAGPPSARRPLPFPEEALKTVREGLRMVVAGDGGARGSGWRCGEGLPVPVSGKTGTAEVGRGATRRKNTWFIAYAPSEDPTVAVALVIEDGESGGGTAAPRVNAILRHVFGKEES